MFCAQCGQKLAAKGRFCANCGTAVWLPPDLRADPSPAAPVDVRMEVSTATPIDVPMEAPVATPVDAPLETVEASLGARPDAPSAAEAAVPAADTAQVLAEPAEQHPLPPSAATATLDPTASNAAASAQPGAGDSGAVAAVQEEGFLGRIRGLLFSPSTEWRLIAAESSSTAAVGWRYLTPLALLGAVAVILGYSLIGYDMPFFGHRRASLVASVTRGGLQFVFAFIGAFLISWLVGVLASTFGGRRDPTRAFKVTAFGLTPFWLAATLQIVPSLGMLALLVGLLYGFYLMYLGLPPLMGSPRDKSIGYIIVVALCSILLWMLVAALTTCAVVAFGVAGESAQGRLAPQDRKALVADPTDVPATSAPPKADPTKGRITNASSSKAGEKKAREAKKGTPRAGASKSQPTDGDAPQARQRDTNGASGGAPELAK